MIILFVASSLTSILANSISINKAEYNNFTSLCTNSIITCIDKIPSIQKADRDLKKQTDLILEQVNSTKLKEWINTLSSFHTRHTKSDHIENVAYWLKNELETLCENRVFFHNFTQIDENQTFHLKNIICMISYRPSNESNKVILEYDVGNKYLQNDNYSKTIALFIKQIATNYTNLQAQLAKLGNSDFIPFEELGSTVIGIHDEGVTKNPNYHKSSDTSNTLNIEYATSITKMTLATILELDRLNKYLKR